MQLHGGRTVWRARRDDWYKDPRTARLKRRVLGLKRALAARDGPAPGGSDRWVHIREIEHRAKNSLQLAATMLLVHGKGLEEPGLRAHLETAALRLTALAGLHARMHDCESMESIPLKPWLQQVCKSVPAGPGVIIDIVAPDDAWPVELARPIGLFVFESVTNALKHGIRGAGRGRIIVSLKRIRGRHRLQVIDDGDGGLTSPVAGLGMTLCKAFADQIGGTLSSGRLERGGFRTRIDFNAEVGPT